MSRPRRIAVLWHRYVGLALAAFLTVVGLSGAAVAWNNEGERVFAPALFRLAPELRRRPPLDPFALREAAARAAPGYAVNGVDFTRRPDQPALFSVEARPGGPAPAEDQIALDPSSGRVLGARRYGDLRQGAVNLMPFLYNLHDSLALGSTGALVLGVAALLWTVDCFVGAYLTFPARARMRRPPPAWLARWRRAWAVRASARPFKVVFDLHQAGGLWLWGMLFVMAWSSVSLNLPQVYNPVMGALFGSPATPPAPPARNPATPPRLAWRSAHARAQVLMAAAARWEGFAVRDERLMFYDPATHLYAYRVRSDRDPGRTGMTQLTVDGDTGAPVRLSLATGGDAGTTVTTWIENIHEAQVFGRPLQVLLTVTGLGLAMLSVTGVWIWWRKFRARSLRAPHGWPAASRKRTWATPE